MTPQQVDKLVESCLVKKSNKEVEALKAKLKAYEFFTKDLLPELVLSKSKGHSSRTYYKTNMDLDKDSFSTTDLMEILQGHGWGVQYVNLNFLDRNRFSVTVEVKFEEPYIQTSTWESKSISSL